MQSPCRASQLPPQEPGPEGSIQGRESGPFTVADSHDKAAVYGSQNMKGRSTCVQRVRLTADDFADLLRRTHGRSTRMATVLDRVPRHAART